MSEIDALELIKQHAEILRNVERLWLGVIMLAFLGLGFILTMIFVAVWSVRSVNKRAAIMENKWTELLDLLIHNARGHD